MRREESQNTGKIFKDTQKNRGAFLLKAKGIKYKWEKLITMKRKLLKFCEGT